MADLIAKWYTPKTEEKKQKPKKFKIRPLTSVELWEINSHMKLNANNQLAISFEGQKLSLSLALQDWENVFDEKGEKAKCHEGNWHLVNPYCLSMAANEARLISEVTEDERKN